MLYFRFSPGDKHLLVKPPNPAAPQFPVGNVPVEENGPDRIAVEEGDIADEEICRMLEQMLSKLRHTTSSIAMTTQMVRGNCERVRSLCQSVESSLDRAGLSMG